MKIIIALLVAAVSLVYAKDENTCMVFKCGNIEQKEGDNSTMCVHAHHVENVSHLVQDCPDNKT